MGKKQKLQFGIMCDGIKFRSWEADCIKKLISSGNAEPKILIINKEAENKRKKFKKISDINHFLFNFYNHIIVNKTSVSNKLIDMNYILKNTEKIKCLPVHKGKFSEYFEEKDIRIIKEKKLDFIIRFGFNIIRGEILKSAKYGVWSFHHGDEEKYRGSPPCFWEIYNKEIISCAILQKLTERLDGGIILQKGFFHTKNYSYGKNRDNVFMGSSDWPAKVCSDIINKSAEYIKNKPSKSNAKIYKRPSNLEMIKYSIKLINNKIKKFLEYIFSHEQWNIGVIKGPIHSFLEKDFKPAIKWLPINKKNDFKADPFIIKKGKKLVILIETYDYKKLKGNISYIELKKDKATKPRDIINENIHLSYPYIIKNKNNIYCIPEALHSNELSIYKAVKFPEKWIKLKTLIKDIKLVDPTIIKYKGYWWLFASKKDITENTKLSIWYSKKLFGSWREHSSNPVKIDVSSSRSAGTPFIYKKNLYRPAQDCSESYGKKIIINKIIKLTPNRFKEEKVAEINSDNKSLFNSGLHTISSAGNITIIDGKRYKFIMPFLSSRIKNAFKYLINK